LVDDFIILDLSCVESFGLLDIVMLELLTCETGDFMILKGGSSFTSLLNKSNHGFGACGIEFVIISRFNLSE
jgi:hypothetical protein